MPTVESYMVRKIGPAASTVTLAVKGGAVLKGIWVSAKGTSPTIVVYDAIASVTGTNIIPSFVPPTAGNMHDFGGIGLGTGLTVKCASVTCTVVYQPSSAL